MSAVLITNDYPPRTGGVARYLAALSKTCADCLEVDYRKELPGRLGLFLLVKKYTKQRKVIVTSHILPIGTMCFLISLISNLEYIVILHGMDFDLARRNIWKQWLSSRILSNAKHVITNTKALKNEVQSFTNRNDVKVIYPVVSDEFIEASHILKKTENKEVNLLTVSRLVERKGHMKVLELVKKDPDLRYTIVGNGILKDQILEYIDQNNLHDRVELLESVSDRKLPSIYSKADIFVMPTQKFETDREGFGIVYIESQLFNTPVIATGHLGVDEALIDQETGYLIDGSLSELQDSIDRLKHRKLRIEMGQNGREFVLENFTRDNQFSKFKDLICD